MKQNIVLDLDQTLVNTVTETEWRALKNLAVEKKNKDLEQRLYSFHLSDDSTRTRTIYGVIRPGAIDALRYYRTRFHHKIVWSAGRSTYVHATVSYIFGLAGYEIKHDGSHREVFTRDDCIKRVESDGFETYIKSLRIIYATHSDMTPANTFLLDDKHDVTDEDMCNQIRIPEYHPDRRPLDDHDLSLQNVMRYFEIDEVKTTLNVRGLAMSQRFIFGR